MAYLVHKFWCNIWNWMWNSVELGLGEWSRHPPRHPPRWPRQDHTQLPRPRLRYASFVYSSARVLNKAYDRWTVRNCGLLFSTHYSICRNSEDIKMADFVLLSLMAEWWDFFTRSEIAKFKVMYNNGGISYKCVILWWLEFENLGTDILGRLKRWCGGFSANTWNQFRTNKKVKKKTKKNISLAWLAHANHSHQIWSACANSLNYQVF